MDQSNNFLSEFDEKEKTGTLKTLTVLTFIGCGLAFIFSILGYLGADKSYTAAQELVNSGKINDIPALFRDAYSPEGIEKLRKMAENKLPIFFINLISTGLCLAGAIQMRKLKADGYWMWLIGELFPYLGFVIFVGVNSLTGLFNYIFYVIVAVFILLYTMQRKYLTK